MLANILWVGCGGFIGATLRYLITFFFGTWYVAAFPLATFVVNLIGCFLMGLFSVCIPWLWPTKSEYLLFGTTGLLGGFTTLSTFGLETWGLIQDDRYLMAVAYMFATMAVCLAGVVLGRFAGRALMGH